jgi:hypothetical protein
MKNEDSWLKTVASAAGFAFDNQRHFTYSRTISFKKLPLPSLIIAFLKPSRERVDVKVESVDK